MEIYDSDLIEEILTNYKAELKVLILFHSTSLFIIL
jgi:hypothetical protein